MSIVSPKQALEMLTNEQAVLVDVRSPEEFKQEHIAYAVSIPLGQLASVFEQWPLPRDRVVLFQCQKGKRGQMACEHMLQNGGESYQVLNIEGGIDGWKESGLPVVRAEEQKSTISIMRQVQIVMGLLIALLIAFGYLTGTSVLLLLAGVLAFALMLSGMTGWCGLALVLKAMPWNK